MSLVQRSCRLVVGAAVCLALMGATAAPARAAKTRTPIRHVIVIVGENRTFDNLYATYAPRAGQTIWNLRSQGIVTAEGVPGPHFDKARQAMARTGATYTPTPERDGFYPTLPQPYAFGAFGQRRDAPDARFPADMPNGPFQITRHVPYGAHTGDPVHRFFQMWQQVDGGRNDLFVWATNTAGMGPSNPIPNYGPEGSTYQGGVAMGFYNMATGDAPVMKRLSDRYTIADNYHQPIMGGTMANYFALATGDVAVHLVDGKPARPADRLIENPDPRPGTNNWYKEDGYRGGSYVACADPLAPGVAGIRAVLAGLPYKPFNDGNCAPGTWYMVNNMDPGYAADGTPLALGDDKFLLPPQVMRHIGDVMTEGGVSWKWYSGGRNDGKATDKEYCGMCDTPTFFTATMTGPDRAKLRDLQDFWGDAADAARFPEVAFIAPYDSVSGHPGYAMTTGFDELVAGVVAKVQANPALWRETAILVTFDEGGGYYDSGYVQAIDFFGDGTRIPLIAVSPFSKRGHVDHTYYDHVSILKFIEANWGLGPISARSRDNLPNPRHVSTDPYVPTNRPAIGDLMNLFDFATPRAAR